MKKGAKKDVKSKDVSEKQMKVDIKDRIMVVRFNGNKDFMNECLDVCSIAYEGPLGKREGKCESCF